MMGSAYTWTEYCSAEAASCKVSRTEPLRGAIRATVGAPRVKVPDLSKAADFTFARRSSVPAYLTKTLARDADDMPPLKEKGAPIRKGQGAVANKNTANRH